jgi:uncharacterized protein with GYD domain
MPTYITLANYTNQGIKNIKESVKAGEESVKTAEKMGEKIIGFYHIMGEYDVIVISECSGDEVAVAGSIMASSDGSVRTKTLRAFTPEEFSEMIKKLP